MCYGGYLSTKLHYSLLQSASNWWVERGVDMASRRKLSARTVETERNLGYHADAQQPGLYLQVAAGVAEGTKPATDKPFTARSSPRQRPCKPVSPDT